MCRQNNEAEIILLRQELILFQDDESTAKQFVQLSTSDAILCEHVSHTTQSIALQVKRNATREKAALVEWLQTIDQSHKLFRNISINFKPKILLDSMSF